MICAIIGIYLTVMAVIDARRKCIPVFPAIVCMITIIIVQFMEHIPIQTWMPGGCVGVVLYVISKMSRGSIGEGDACIYGVIGMLLGVIKAINILLIALFVCSLYAVLLLALRRVGKRYKIAFLPFTALAYGIVVLI